MLDETGSGSAGTSTEEFSGSTSSETYCARCAIVPVNGNGKFCTYCKEIVRKEDVDAILAKNGVSRDQVEGKGDMITQEQRQLIAFLAKKQKIDANRVCWSFANRSVEQLSQAEADGFIRHLHNLGKPAAEAIGSTPTPDPTDRPKTEDTAPSASTPAALPYTPAYEGDPGPDWAEKLGAEYQAAREEAAINESDLPEYPAEFVRALVKSDNKITRTEVFSVLAEFQMSISLGEAAEKADAIVVTDRSQTALMKQARELRLQLRKERLRLESIRTTVKEPFLRRIQIIDGIGKTIRDLFQEKEQHLLDQEKFIERDDARIAAEKQAERIAALAAFEYVPTDDLTTVRFGNMTDAEWDAYYGATRDAYNARKAEEAAAAEAKRLEDERLAIANALLQRNADRLRQVQAAGFIPQGGKLVYFALPAETEVAEKAVTDATDDEFTTTLKYLETIAAEFKAIEARRHQRTCELVDLGMRRDGERFEFEGIRVEAALLDAPVTEWMAEYSRVSDKIGEIREQQNAAKIAAEAARIAAQKEAEELAAKAEAARKAAQAPDKEKLETLIAAYESIAVPEMTNELTRQVLSQFTTKVNNALADLRRQTGQLG